MAQKKMLSTDDVDDTPVNGVTTEPVSSNWAYDHSVDLDAHMADVHQTLRTGEFMDNPLLVQYTYATTPLANDTLYAVPFFVARSMTVDKIGFRCHVLEADKSARVGIYADGTNLYPGALVVDAGTTSLATAANKEVTISGDQSLTKGLYWIAILSDATGTAELVDKKPQFSILGKDSGNVPRGQNAGWSVAQAYGALPDPFTAAGSLKTTEIWDIVLKLKSLD